MTIRPRALRGLLSPALVLAIGVGGLTAASAVFQAAVARPLPYASPEMLVRIWDANSLSGFRTLSAEQFRAIRSSSQHIAEMAPFVTIEQSIQAMPGADGRRVRGVLTSAALFDVLGTASANGTPVIVRDDLRAQVVVSDRMRQAGIVEAPGDEILIDGIPHQVIAVMGGAFWFPDATTNYWLPALSETPAADEGWHAPVIARLAQGVEEPEALGEVRALLTSANADALAVIRSVREEARSQAYPALASMRAAVSLLLLLTLCSVAWLLAAQATHYRHRFALMSAFGAGQWHIFHTQVLRALSLASIALPLGLMIGWVALRYVVERAGPFLPTVVGSSLTLQVVLITSACTLILSAIAMTPSAWIARTAGQDRGLLHSTKNGGPRFGETGLMIAQSSVVMALAMNAIALAWGFGALMNANVGFGRTDNVVIGFTGAEGVSSGLASQFESLQSALSTYEIPAAVVNANPLSEREQLTSLRRPLDGETVMVGLKTVTSNYFEIVGMEAVNGRLLNDGDAGQGSLMLNEAAARFLFGEAAVGGRQLRASSSDWQIVGVVKSVRQRSLFDEPRPELYVLYRDLPRLSPKAAEIAARRYFVVARDGHGTGRTTELVRALSSSALPGARLESAAHFRSLVEAAAEERPVLLEAVSGIGLTALALLAAGLYAMFSQAVQRRRREIAIRMSLGARPRRILLEQLRPAVFIWLASTVIGALAYRWGTGLISASLLASPDLPDRPFPVLLGVSSGVLLIAMLLAALRPLIQASHVQPAAVLKAE